MSGLTYVDVHSVYDATDKKWATAQCPQGMRVIGGGAIVVAIDSNAPIAITYSAPQNGLITWHAEAKELWPHGGTWRVVAVALCAKVTL